MGTEFRITISAIDTNGLAAAVGQAFKRVDALELSMSDYRADSELNQLRGSTKWQSISTGLHEVLWFSRQLARQSGGAFDPTVGPLTKLWRRAFRQQQFPDREDILAARTQVHWKDLKISKRRPKVRLRRPDMRLDLGGVAKGYALDVVGGLLREAGFPAFIVDGGGDLLLGASPYDQPLGWSIAFPGGTKQPPLSDIAIATSGDTYRFLEHQGIRYSHIIDPRTGMGVKEQVIVSVLGKKAMIADGLASTYSLGVAVLRKYRKYEQVDTWPLRAEKEERLPITYD